MHKETLITIFLTFFTVLIVALAIFIVVIVLRYHRRQTLHAESLRNIAVQHQNELLQTQIEIQEQTFGNIARDIHDNVGQKLSLAKLHLVNAIAVAPAPMPELQDAMDIIGNSLEDLRGLSRTLSSDLVLHNGFVFALSSEIEKLQRLNLFTITQQVNGEAIFMDGDRELTLFRMVQELLQNIIKHAAASKVAIVLLYEPGWLTIQVIDNGKGFNVAEQFIGQGMHNLKKRSSILQGELSFTSQAGLGTTCTIKIPTHLP
jgi:two-component system, NarL family, sensor kinase